MARHRENVTKETWTTMAIVFGLSLAASVLGGASPALAVIWVPLAYYYAWRAPVWVGARMLVLLGLFIEPPSMVPGATYWESPLIGADNVFYGQLKKLLPIPGASMSLFFLAVCLLLYRAVRKQKHPLRNMPAMRLARDACVGFIIALALIEVWGVLRGGSVEHSFFQAIQMLTLPLLGMALMYSLRGQEDYEALGKIVVNVALARGALVAFTYFVICLPRGINPPEYCTTHGDSTTFAAAFLILGANAVVDRRRRTLWRLVVLGTCLLAAMVMNNRRLVFVCVGAGAMAMYLALPPSRARRRLNRILLVAGPLLFVYLMAGEGTNHPFFAPARLAWSALEQKDTSSDSRDVENLNLIATLADHPILGSGFGHEYKEVLKVYEIAEFMPLYRYIPHNSVLWLWTVGGLVGFVALWSLAISAAYLAARAYRRALSVPAQVASLTAVGVVAVWIMANWGDIGIVSENNVMIFALALAVAAKVNAETEATVGA